MTQQRNLNTPTGGNVCMTRPTNADRARWAAEALAVFTAETFSGDHPDTMHRGEPMIYEPELITDIKLQALNLDIDLRKIAREHPEATWDEPMASDWSRTWTVRELSEHVSAIETVLGIIADTPNGYINQEALHRLRQEFKPAIEFLQQPEVQQWIDEINARWL